MAVLFIIEFQDFLAISVVEQLYVDTTRLPSMKINFDITFPQIACMCKYIKTMSLINSKCVIY